MVDKTPVRPGHTGPVELSSAARFLSVAFQCERPFDATRELLMQVAFTSDYPDEVRTKYFREAGYSVVQAVAHIESGMGGFFRFEAQVFVRVQYRGDMVRIAPAVRTAISKRLDALAQKHCMDFVSANFIENDEVPLIPGWHGVPEE
ncbi:MAG: hypothetical protein ABIF71_04295 [Planctomycetota bacterium]